MKDNKIQTFINPLKENSKIVEALARTNLSPYENRILHAVLGKTDCSLEEWAKISVGQFASLAGLDRGNAGRAVRSLVDRNIIARKFAGSKIFYRFQRDYRKWRCVFRDTVTHTYKDKNNNNNNSVCRRVSKNTDGKDFLDWYGAEWAKKFEKHYFLRRKDQSLATELLKSFSIDELKKYTVEFFNDNDPWVRKSGYEISVFANQINRFVSKGKKLPIGLDDYSKYRKMKND